MFSGVWVLLLTLSFWTALMQGQGSLPADQFVVLSRDHVDSPCVLYDASRHPALSLVAWQHDARLDLPTNQVIFVVKEQSKLRLPAGTPFGDEGAPLWILPQSQNANLLYLGLSVERVASGVFAGPLTIALKQVEGPGYFLVWQATGPGEYSIRVDSRDGVNEADGFQPLPGAHEHFNWGFSAPGVYSLTFQASGRRLGESTNIVSANSTFVFHVQPLPAPARFETWQRQHWPPGFNPPTTLAYGNPDGDDFDNWHEYAFGLSPTNRNPVSESPQLSVLNRSENPRAQVQFWRNTAAEDLTYRVEKTSRMPGGWSTVTNLTARSFPFVSPRERVEIPDLFGGLGSEGYVRVVIEGR